jgi:hypothetical protein
VAKTVSNSWRKFTPGACLACGYDTDWEIDGRGTIYCSCECCAACGEHDGHTADCLELASDVEAQVAAAMGWGYDSGSDAGGL